MDGSVSNQIVPRVARPYCESSAMLSGKITFSYKAKFTARIVQQTEDRITPV